MRQLAQVADGMSSNLSLVLDNDRLAISGIEFCWPVGGALRNDGFVPGVKISIKGPGHIEYQEGTLAVAYNKGRQIRLRPLQQNEAIRAWIADTECALHEQAISSLKSDAVWGPHEERPEFPNGVMLTFLCSAIRTIENGGHGGTILVLPTAHDAKCIDVRFPALSNDLTTLVRRFGEASLLAAKEGFSTTSPLSPSMVSEHDMMSTLEAFGVAFAKLANCDGAIVMTRDARLLGFGGIIQSPAPALCRTQPRQARGARHTSAQWLCESVPNSIALVVSADRGITLIHSLERNTQITKDLVVW
nr:diadenylate cyclase [Stieleria neptunia]